MLPLLAAGAAMGLASGIGKALASSNRRRPQPIEYGDEAFRQSLRAQALGQGPSVAALQAQYQSDEARNAAMSLGASGTGAQVGAARLAAGQNNAAAQAGIGKAAALGRVEEKRAGQAMYGSELAAKYQADMANEQAQAADAEMRAKQRAENVQGIFGGMMGGMSAAAGLPGGAGGGGMGGLPIPGMPAAPMFAQQDPTSELYDPTGGAGGPVAGVRPIDEIAAMYPPTQPVRRRRPIDEIAALYG